jgi:hypothetical protein
MITHEHERRRKNAVRAPDIKLAQIDRLGLLALVQQNASDQVSGNDEKYTHPGGGKLEKAAGSMSALGHVAEHDEDDRNRPQAVERWNALHIRILP